MKAADDLSFADLAADALPLAGFALGALTPRVALAPHDPQALAAIVRRCDEAGQAAVVFGGGTLQALGDAPRRYDVAISTARLDALVAYDPRDLTIAVQAGMSLRTLSATLAEHGQFVPLDAPRPERATVGGTLAAGWLGPRRLAYGRPRDLLIGSTAALADGTLSSAGGMVVKNVSGYDVSKLFVGSLGTLGILVRANFKALPLPARMRVAIAALPERTAERTLAHLDALAVEPTCALLVRGFAREIDGSDGLDGRLAIVFEGSAALVDRATRDLRSALGAAGVPGTAILDDNAPQAYQRIVDAYVAEVARRSLTLRAPGDASDAPARAAALAALGADRGLAVDTLADVRTGDAIARFAAPEPSAMVAAAAALVRDARAAVPGAIVIAGHERIRTCVEAWDRPPPSAAKLAALKARFDPRGTLAQGRLVGGI